MKVIKEIVVLEEIPVLFRIKNCPIIMTGLARTLIEFKKIIVRVYYKDSKNMKAKEVNYIDYPQDVLEWIKPLFQEGKLTGNKIDMAIIDDPLCPKEDEQIPEPKLTEGRMRHNKKIKDNRKPIKPPPRIQAKRKKS